MDFAYSNKVNALPDAGRSAGLMNQLHKRAFARRMTRG
jgi:hypothetical protein